MKRDHGPSADLDKRIEEAELSVVLRDQRMRAHAEDIAVQLQQHTGRLMLIGLAGASVIAFGLLLRGRGRPDRRAPAPGRRSGLFGSIAQVALGLPARPPAMISMLAGIVLPILSRWWRARDRAER